MDRLNWDRLRIDLTTWDEIRGTDCGVLAKRDGLSFKDTQNTTWFKVILDGTDLIAIFGLIRVNDSTLRLKSIFVLPEWRRMGVLGFIGDQSAQMTGLLGFTKVVAIVRLASKEGLLKAGWKLTPNNPKLNKVELDVEAHPAWLRNRT